MPIAQDTSKTWEYILKCDRGCDHPSVFILRAMSVADEARIQDSLVTVDAATKVTTVKSGSHALEVLRIGLLGWKDFFLPSGEPAPFVTDKSRRMRGFDPVSDESLDRLRPDHRRELAEAIIERNTIAEDERKNFSSGLAS